MCCAHGGSALFTISTKLDSYGSIRRRLGYAFDRWLIFGTGGWARGDWQTSYAFTSPHFVFSTNSTTQGGWTAGAGINYALLKDLFLSLEYRYTALDATSFTDIPHNAGELGNTVKLNDIRAGIGVKF